MEVAITLLPDISAILLVAGEPRFIIVRYAPFVALAAAAPECSPPDIVATLDIAEEHTFVVFCFNNFRKYIGSLEIVGSVDEKYYLRKHPDVKEGVKQGMVKSGTQHYIIQGYFERREVEFAPAETTTAT